MNHTLPRQTKQKINRSRARTIGGICLILFIFSVHLWLFRNFFVDDAYITFRFVQQWAAGNGLVYNIGERVEGYSNFLWIVLLAPFQLSGANLVAASKMLGSLFSLLTLFVTWRFGRRFSHPLLTPLLLVCSAPFIIWAMGGLETQLFTFLLLLASYTYAREEENGAGWFSGLLFGLLALARPEGVLFAGVTILHRAWRLRQNRQRPSTQDWARLTIFLLITGGYFLWRYNYYGYLLPNTVYAKSMGLHPRGFIEGAFYVYRTMVILGGFFFLALPIALAMTDPRRDFAAPYLFINVMAYLLFMFASGGDWMPAQRFAVHILPLIYLLTAAGLNRLFQLWSGKTAHVLLLLLILGQAFFLLAASLEQYLVKGEGRVIHTRQDNQKAAAYLLEKVNPGDTIAVVDAGIYSYFLPLDVRVLDMVGLTNERIAHLKPQFPQGLMGRGDGFGKWDTAYILAQEPEIVQITSLRQNADSSWSSNFTGATELINDPSFQSRYKQTKFNFFERTEAE